jgi:enamine deaminase RidA (YjgF/YER057c/UK114 family)
LATILQLYLEIIQLNNFIMTGKITNINPEGLFKNPAFSQAVTTEGNGKTIYVGGQNAIDEKGTLVGKDNVGLQSEQVMRNIQVALAAAGATFSDVIKMSIYLVQGQDAKEAFTASQPFMKECPQPPAITAVFVAALGNPEYLLEVEAIAFKAQEK